MLTAEEMAKLKYLQEKAKNHQPISDEELDKMENRNCQEVITPEKIRILIDAWNRITEIITTLGKDNVRLISEVRYWKEKANTNIQND